MALCAGLLPLDETPVKMTQPRAMPDAHDRRPHNGTPSPIRTLGAATGRNAQARRTGTSATDVPQRHRRVHLPRFPDIAIAKVASENNYERVQVLTNLEALDRPKQLAVVEQFTQIVADPAGRRELNEHAWVLLTEAPEGGWGLWGHAHTNAELVAAARAEVAELAGGADGIDSTLSETHFIVLPGGDHAVYAEHEAGPNVDWLGGVGIPATVLQYPLNAQHPIPLDAVRSEVRRLRATGVARVGVGFSAGGHLAGHAGLSGASSAETRIDLAMLGYAITSMEMETYRSARLILLGENAPPEAPRATSLDALVTSAAPPFFVWHTSEDAYGPVEHSYRLGAALAAYDIPHALHVFSTGPHSLGLARRAGEPSAWTELAAAWLLERLDLLKRGGRQPVAIQVDQPTLGADGCYS